MLKLSVCAVLAVVLFGVIVPRLQAAPGQGLTELASVATPFGVASLGQLNVLEASRTASPMASSTPSATALSTTTVNLRRISKPTSQTVSGDGSSQPLEKQPLKKQSLEKQALVKRPAPKQPVQAQSPASAVQLRGLWVDGFGPGFKTPAEVDRLVKNAIAMRVNAIFMQVGRRGDCYCNKASMPRTADPELAPGFDPLAYLLQRAHRVGIQVHAWIITTAIWNVKYPVGARNHVFVTRSAKSLGRDNWLTERFDGPRQAGVDYMLDPGHPDAAEYIAQMYLSVIRNYDVDGIQFDRVRYPDSTGPEFLPVWGYNPTALARFQAETNRPGDQPARPDPTDPQWAQWRRNQITDLVRRVYLEAKSIRPELWVSAATITYREPPQTLDAFSRTRTYAEVLQDWASWMQEGMLDLNIPMNYKRERDGESGAWFDGWNRFAVLTRGAGSVAVGAGLYLNSLEDNMKQLRRSVKQDGVNGWVGYSYRTPDVNVFGARRSSADGVRLLTNSLRAQGAPFAAAARWQTAPTANLRGVLGRVMRSGQALSGVPIELTAQDGDVRVVQSDANGYFGATMLPVGSVLVRVQDQPEPSLTLEVMNGRVVRAPNLNLP